MNFEILNLIFDFVSAVAAILAAMVALITLRKSRNEQKKGLEREKRQATLEAYNKLQEQVFDKINQYSPSDVQSISENINSEAYKILGSYLARIEHFCVGLTTDIYDYDTFYELAHGYFDDDGMLYKRMMPLLGRKLGTSKNDYFSNIHEVLKEMEEMAKERQ